MPFHHYSTKLQHNLLDFFHRLLLPKELQYKFVLPRRFFLFMVLLSKLHFILSLNLLGFLFEAILALFFV